MSPRVQACRPLAGLRLAVSEIASKRRPHRDRERRDVGATRGPPFSNLLPLTRDSAGVTKEGGNEVVRQFPGLDISDGGFTWTGGIF